jgi:hypothetical protein
VTLEARRPLVASVLVALYTGAAGAAVLLTLGLALGTEAPTWLLVLLAWGATSLSVLAVLYVLARRGVHAAPILRVGPPAAALRVLLLPYRLVQYVWIAVRREAAQEPAAHEVAPGLFLGGRMLPWERRVVRALGVTAVLDLCAERPEAPTVRAIAGGRYVAAPTLDGGTLPDAVFDAAVERVVAWRRAGARVLVHCALGHGRSASVAAAVLVAAGDAPDAAAALGRLNGVRPNVGLHDVQRASLDRWVARKEGRGA